MKVVLFTYHYYASKRRGGFHFLADAYAHLGWDVVFVTAPISWLSKLGDDPRFQYPVRHEAGRLVPVAPSIRSYVHFTPFHPANLRNPVLNALSSPVFRHVYPRFRLGPLVDELRDADLVILESTSALLLLDRLRSLAPRARIVYRVSDDMQALRLHPLVRGREHELASRCDLVSTTSAGIQERFADLPRSRQHRPGIEKAVFDAPVATPYDSGPNVVFVGFWTIDREFLQVAARAHPDVTFHVIGQDAGVVEPNVVSYPEMPFRDTVPFVKHADVGLQTIAYRPGVEVLTDGLKVIQFSYVGVPVVMPTFIKSPRPNVVTYQPGDDRSAARAIDTALAMDVARQTDVPSWEELATEIAADSGDA
jgi:2-beta-glucuronyltransferase